MKPIEKSPRRRLLLVEDDAADHMLIRRALADSSHVESIEIVEDGEEALAYLQRQGRYDKAHLPDLIIMDFNLPKADAIEILSRIRATPELAIIPVIIFSTTESPRDVSRAYAAGANGFLVKPPDLDAFFDCLKALDEFWLKYATLPRHRQ